MKRKSPTPSLPYSSPLLLRPLPDISLATWDLDPLSHHHCIKDITCCRWRFINETDVSHTFNLQKVWDQQLWLLIFIRSTIPMISGDFLTRWNAITVGKGRGILQYFIFLHRSLRPVSNVVLLPCRTQLIELNSTLARQSRDVWNQVVLLSCSTASLAACYGALLLWVHSLGIVYSTYRTENIFKANNSRMMSFFGASRLKIAASKSKKAERKYVSFRFGRCQSTPPIVWIYFLQVLPFGNL